MHRTLEARITQAALAFVFLFSCSSSDTTTENRELPDLRPPTPPEWDRPVSRTDEPTASAARAACTFKRGALPDETLGSSIPTGKDIPIETIVVLMQENRSFDHYFGHFGKYAGRTDVIRAPEDATNPEKISDPQSPKHPWQRAPHLCFLDTDHEWDASHVQYDDGKMDGFFQTNNAFTGDPNGERALYWYDERELPFYYGLAKAFGLGDQMFASVLGPTWPNRMYLTSGTSFGMAANFFPNIDAYPFPGNDAVVLDELDKRHVDWKLYTGGGPPGITLTVGLTLNQRWGRNVVSSMEDFLADAKAGKLPPVSFIDADFLRVGDPDGPTEHPPGDIQVGQKFVSDVVHALFESPQWSKSVLFLTYDEHGGIYDHFPPPKACPPDDKLPIDEHRNPLEGAFDRYGVRVPLLVVSPYAKKGFVSHSVYDHTSILRFIQAKFRVPALSSRDANALIPTDFFDFANPPNLDPPELPEATVDPNELEYCNQTFRK